MRGRVYRFERVGREKYPAARTVRLQKAAGGSGNPALSAAFFRAFHVDKKMWNTNFPPRQPPRAACPPAARGRCRAEQWWSFIVSLVSSKRMTCSSAMYSDTATLTLKYHVWRVTIRLGARGVRKNRSGKPTTEGWFGDGSRGTQNSTGAGTRDALADALAISCSAIVRGTRLEIPRNARGSVISISH